MDGSYPLAFFSSPGMISVFIIVMLAEAVSLGFLWIVSYEFRQMMRKHAGFFVAISDNTEEHERAMRSSYIWFWMYVFFTFFIGILTTVIFLFQPHLL